MRQLAGTSSRIALLLVGAFFVVSAVAKVMAMIDFEMYVYRLNFMPLWLCAVMCRGLVAAECVVGIGLCVPMNIEIGGRRIKAAAVSALFLLFVFSLFLLFLIGEGVGGNCHCMGEMLDMEPKESLVKNVVLGAMLLFGMRYCDTKTVSAKRFFIVSGILFAVVIAGATAYSPPDFMIVTKERKASQEKLREYFENTEISDFAKEGRRMICVFSPRCGTCKLCASKTAAMGRRTGIADSLVLVLMRYDRSGEEDLQRTDIEEFVSVTNISFPCFRLVNEDTLGGIAPRVPTIILLEDDSVVGTRSYRALAERDMEWVMGKTN